MPCSHKARYVTPALTLNPSSYGRNSRTTKTRIPAEPSKPIAVAVHATRLAECIRRAHHNAGVKPGDVDYICAHGTGTRANDATETAAVREVFNDSPPPISSIKSMLGHTMGAAAGFGALACCAALFEGFLPPTATVRQVDSALGPDLDCVPGQARAARPRVAQNHGFAFGGNNAVTMFGGFSR